MCFRFLGLVWKRILKNIGICFKWMVKKWMHILGVPGNCIHFHYYNGPQSVDTGPAQLKSVIYSIVFEFLNHAVNFRLKYSTAFDFLNCAVKGCLIIQHDC